uniref:Histidine kinase-, DNA gyrase B-, and HSP90-like ATPase n=1 Tax=Candidatus Kentrum sp. TUN TaxID=2126343 RepID=A0A450ZD44_9GAMM|nr:MAG: hypothetical protein BECKTUN1418D_GA0071000_101021 [Candidatus Kentron sp. TUN]VFK52295.1 MAG: hypothetical protein BECKTUN1418F_GA0071002_10073 [Candidatus Kentron sp. TUN]VFK52720.1 MAG: hypothetical protein BECKTUN1418E_GA0071001_10093 [Candidatus Kentron sp. TUN]
MNLHTNLQGRLRNTHLSKNHGLQPVFETVVNSIHALEERGNLADGGTISLRIQRNPQEELDSNRTKDIDAFIVEDNGIGFNEDNMRSFETLDSDHKISKGCRGVGRLLWLKVFDYVEIHSSYKDPQNEINDRIFTFDKDGIKVIKKTENFPKSIMTRIYLQGFDKEYKKSTPRKIEAIARALLEHCLWYFARPEGAPEIIVRDDHQSINLHDLYSDYMHESAKTEMIRIKESNFDLIHIKFRASSSKKHSLSLCAANRLVKEEEISGKIPGLHGRISDNDGEFTYCCYVRSSYLDERVRSERTSFNIVEDSKETGELFPKEIALKEIREEVLARSQKYLKEHLEKNTEAGKNRIYKFVSEKSPRYRPILRYMSERELAVDPNITNKDLELHLHKKLAEVEGSMLEQGHEIMANPEGDIDDYKEKLDRYLQTASDIKMSDLASYVSHRRVVLDLLKKSIQTTEPGKYAKEKVIHNLIMPMGKDSNEIWTISHNLWLVDERLTFHNYLASNKKFTSMPATENDTAKTPDLFTLNVYDKPLLISEKQMPPLASITIIELKRPMRNDAKEGEEKNPIEQVLRYLKTIREDGVITANGTHIPKPGNIPGYCYVICDLTPSMIGRCEMAGLRISGDNMGYFGFNESYGAYIEVISYIKLVTAAEERNKAFFDKLGLPTN